eukprot:11268070-Karenia_brevis.AAC.1
MISLRRNISTCMPPWKFPTPECRLCSAACIPRSCNLMEPCTNSLQSAGATKLRAPGDAGGGMMSLERSDQGPMLPTKIFASTVLASVYARVCPLLSFRVYVEMSEQRSRTCPRYGFVVKAAA